jgi:hypothetical protein
MLIFLYFACVLFFSSFYFGTKHPPLDEICNLIDPTNTDMEGNDRHTNEPNDMHQVLQQSFQFFLQYVVISSAFLLCPTAIVYAHTQDSTN